MTRTSKRHTPPVSFLAQPDVCLLPQPADLARYAEAVANASDQDLVAILRRLTVWKYPRSDLSNWIPVLDKFDGTLAAIKTSYELSRLQTNDFTPKDKELVLEVLRFQRLLLENCTNRKLFSSYDVSEVSY